MKSQLIYDLIQFAVSKKNIKDRVKYFFMGLIFYISLINTASGKGKGNSSSTDIATGDDIYPLF